MREKLLLPGLIKFIILIIFQLLIIISTMATDVFEGDVSGVWDNSGSPYLIHGNINIPAGNILEIQLGTEVLFTGEYSLHVNGAIIARGTETELIKISSDQANTWWKSIIFNSQSNNADSSIFSFCSFQKGNGTNGGAIHIDSSSKIRISDCKFENNQAIEEGGAIFCGNNSNPIIVNNEFLNNTGNNRGGAIALRTNCTPVLSGNTFSGNIACQGGGLYIHGCGTQSNKFVIEGNSFKYNESQPNQTPVSAHGGGIYLYAGNTVIKNNSFIANICMKSGGGLYSENCYTEIINNEFSYNEVTTIGNGGALMIDTRSEGLLLGNLICQNEAPASGGVAIYESDFLIINNTFSNNTSNGGGGGLAILFWNYVENIFPVYNNIFWHNDPSQIFITGYFEDMTVDHNVIEYGQYGITGDLEYVNLIYGVNNTDEDPQFTLAGGCEYYPGPLSPCLDTGYYLQGDFEWPQYDVLGQDRFFNDVVDIGAIEHHPISINQEQKLYPHYEISKSGCYPNPFNPSTTIWFEIHEATNIRLVIYNIRGQNVSTLCKGLVNAGLNYVHWDGVSSSGEMVASGIYYYSIETKSGLLSSGKMLLIK